eukprot:Em0001g2462a
MKTIFAVCVGIAILGIANARIIEDEGAVDSNYEEKAIHVSDPVLDNKAASQQKKLWLKQFVTVPFWKKDIPRSGRMRLDGFATGLRTRTLALRSARARTFTPRILKPLVSDLGSLVPAMEAMRVVAAAARVAAGEVVVGALVPLLVPVVGLVQVAVLLLLLLAAAGAVLQLLLLLLAVGQLCCWRWGSSAAGGGAALLLAVGQLCCWRWGSSAAGGGAALLLAVGQLCCWRWGSSAAGGGAALLLLLVVVGAALLLAVGQLCCWRWGSSAAGGGAALLLLLVVVGAALLLLLLLLLLLAVGAALQFAPSNLAQFTVARSRCCC